MNKLCLMNGPVMDEGFLKNEEKCKEFYLKNQEIMQTLCCKNEIMDEFYLENDKIMRGLCSNNEVLLNELCLKEEGTTNEFCLNREEIFNKLCSKNQEIANEVCSTNDESKTISTNDKLDKLISDVSKIKTEQCDIQKTIKFCHAALSVVTRELKTQSIKLDLCFGDVNYLNNECVYLKSKLIETNVSLNDCQQYMRRNIVEIHGVPENIDEDVVQTVIKVISAFGFEMKISMFYAAHRLPKNPFRPKDPRKISFKFIHHSDKESLMKKKKLKKIVSSSDLGYQNNREIYLTDSLTAENRKLLAMMKEVKVEKGIRYVWTTDGKILVRRVEGGPVKVIRSKDDIDSL